MSRGEMNGGFDGATHLVGGLRPGTPKRPDSGIAKSGQGPQFDLAENRVFVCEMPVESSDAQTGAAGDRIAIDALGSMSGKEAQPSGEDPRFGVFEFPARQRVSYLI